MSHLEAVKQALDKVKVEEVQAELDNQGKKTFASVKQTIIREEEKFSES